MYWASSGLCRVVASPSLRPTKTQDVSDMVWQSCLLQIYICVSHSCSEHSLRSFDSSVHVSNLLSNMCLSFTFYIFTVANAVIATWKTIATLVWSRWWWWQQQQMICSLHEATNATLAKDQALNTSVYYISPVVLLYVNCIGGITVKQMWETFGPPKCWTTSPIGPSNHSHGWWEL